MATARAYALDYAKSLANFTCTRLMTRSADDSTTGKHYKQLETQEGELRYADHKETYEAQKVNGETTKLDKRLKKGYFIPGGEFGASLLKIFAPQPRRSSPSIAPKPRKDARPASSATTSPCPPPPTASSPMETATPWPITAWSTSFARPARSPGSASNPTPPP